MFVKDVGSCLISQLSSMSERLTLPTAGGVADVFKRVAAPAAIIPEAGADAAAAIEVATTAVSGDPSFNTYKISRNQHCARWLLSVYLRSSPRLE